MNGELLKKIEDNIRKLKHNIEIHKRNISYLSEKNAKGNSLSESEHTDLYAEKDNLRRALELLDNYEKLHLQLNTQDHLTTLYDAKKNQEDLKKSLVNTITEDFTKYNDYLDSDKEKGILNTLAYNIRYVNMEKLSSDLSTLKSNFVKEDERKDIYEYYYDLLETNIKELYEEGKISDKLEISEAKELKKFDSKNLKIAAGVLGTAIGLIALIAALKSCSKDTVIRDNPTNDETTIESTLPSESETAKATEEPTTEASTTTYQTTEATTTEEPTTLSENDVLVNALIKNGYPKDLATKIVDTYNGYIIGELLTMKNVAGINSEYIMDYLEVMKRYNITLSESVDYVNRAREIEKLNYFYDATLYDVINVLISIDNKDIIKNENNDLEQMVFNPLNDMAEKYYFYENTPEDIVRLEALKYFAKDNTDLDDFLEIYSEYLQRLIEDPYDKKSRDELIHGFAIYASSLNHFDNAECALTDDKEFNEAFQVRDPFDYAIAYKTIITPTNQFYVYPEIYDIDGEHFEYLATIENDEYRNAEIERLGYSEYKDIINKLIEFRGLNKQVDTAIGENEKINCGTSRSLGGE